ncbi:RNA-dependent RNA polymerase [Aspergillus neoniger ourmia-like virus 1]|uniref:RNA-dependent RNA polymerase n=1 Tax=Aspergillus neoniger ourmia-like virus 1 TaxID=2501288 RepID=A0A3Q9NN17_9VIRU|nr:RNA-dependent RNA polymerase [Aspergillus neoniger ourmia-like virus 1]AZT88620.1 RNA-dependent RNA polymerase [Aspergillus neoniger ourmia-like virus 1]
MFKKILYTKTHVSDCQRQHTSCAVSGAGGVGKTPGLAPGGYCIAPVELGISTSFGREFLPVPRERHDARALPAKVPSSREKKRIRRIKQRKTCGQPPVAKEWAARQSRECGGIEPGNTYTRYSLLSHAHEDCTSAASLWKKAYNCVQHLAAELDVEPVKDLPPSILCGQLRSAVEGCFPDSADLRQRLSIKTVQKLERQACPSCEPRFRERLETWREARFQPIEVDEGHLALFKRMFKANIPPGWNRRQETFPYIPNGKASEAFKRTEGGNWNYEEFSDTCRYDLVFSSGKPRIVTMYSSYNSEVLYPLHQCLQQRLSRMGWLLVGPPTAEHVNALSGEGDYLSFDYTSATDNIKQPYVSAAVEALIECADPKLDDDQIRCLRVLSSLKLDEDGPIATRGQPMGSMMSFPLLCLVNKTVVDLALADLLQGGQLSFKEWTSHRLLVNGDDLLTREPRSKPGLNSLATRVFHHGGKVGLESNWEKTLSSPCEAEINSTLFRDGSLVKKTNVASLYMKPDVVDVLGYARESTTTARGFLQVVRNNANLLAFQQYKGYRDLPPTLQRLCRKDRKIRKALKSVPARQYKPEATNFFPVAPRPEGYDLTLEEEVQRINERVREIRPAVLARFDRTEVQEEFWWTRCPLPLDEDDPLYSPPEPPAPRKGRSLADGRSWRSVKFEKKPRKAEEPVLEVLASAWYAKQKEQLASIGRGIYQTNVSTSVVSDLPTRAAALVDLARGLKRSKQIRCDPSTQVPTGLGSPFTDGSDWIALE